MMEFTKLNVACLKEMQMLLDTIADTILKLDTILFQEKNKISKYIREYLPVNFKIEEWQKEINILSQDDSVENFLISDLEIIYSIAINKISKQNQTEYFYLDFGYISDKNQNVVFFQLFNSSEILFLTQSFISELKENISKEWRCDSGNNTETPNIYIEFPIDEIFTIDRINECSKVFRDSILQPVISKLQP